MLTTWEEFERELAAINESIKALQQEGTRHRMEYPLYRGVDASYYPLESTLDRIQKKMSFSEYRRIMKCAHKHVATCTGKKWNLVEDIDQAVAKGCEIIDLGKLQLPSSDYEFMAYLRQNGFPSPLIDWTRSPYIAAYFAFRDSSYTAKSVSIYVHMGELSYGQQSRVWILGPTVATDRKHYLQQSEYSICLREEHGEMHFAKHEDVKEDVEERDVLIKYIVPMSERQKVLRKLDAMNITAYSLFDSEASLIETLALREIVFDTDD